MKPPVYNDIIKITKTMEAHASGFTIRNFDSTELQIYELNSPMLILLETCREKENFFSAYELSQSSHQAFQLPKDMSGLFGERPKHKHDFIEIMYVLSGSVINHVENQTFIYGPGQCCIMNKNIRHCEEFTGEFQVVFFMFQDSFLERALTEYDTSKYTQKTLLHSCSVDGTAEIGRRHDKDECENENPIFQLIRDNLKGEHRLDKVYLDCLPVIAADEALEKVIPLFNFIVEELTYGKPGAFFFIQGAFFRLFYQLNHKGQYCIDRVQSDVSGQDYLFAKITHIMEASHGRSTRKELSRQLHYDAEYLNRIVKKYTGKSILEYGQSIYLKEAASLLLDTNKSVSTIITEMGFSNRSHFYRIFEKNYGMTPQDYRKGAP